LQNEPEERTVENLIAATGLSRREVETALDYYANNQAEIDAELDNIHAAQHDARLAWERRQALRD